MDKIEVEDILISMKTSDNEEIINKLLGKIRTIDEVSLQNAITQAGGTKEAITKFFERKISESQNNTALKHTLINKFFSYGVAGNCIHLHLPTDLHSMIAERGISGTIDTVNMYLLDAIDKIKELKDNEHNEFQGKDSIYMISPILLGRELRFLEELDFKTRTYKKQELNSQEFLSDNPEAKLATQIFGKGKNVGTAQINIDLISSEEWQKKKEEKLKEFASKGITFMSQQLEQVDVSQIDLNNSYFHFTRRDNLGRISREGLKPQIGGASKMKNEEQSRVYLSRGGKGIIEIKNSFIHEFKKLRVCDIPEEYRRYFDIKDYSSQEQVDEKTVYDAMEKRFKDEIYFQVSAKEGEDFLIEDQYDGVFVEDFSRESLRKMFEQKPERDIKGKSNHTISPEQLTRLSTEKGDTAFDIVNYLYNRLLENAKKVGKEDSVKWANSDLNSFFEYIEQREIDAGERV